MNPWPHLNPNWICTLFNLISFTKWYSLSSHLLPLYLSCLIHYMFSTYVPQKLLRKNTLSPLNLPKSLLMMVTQTQTLEIQHCCIIPCIRLEVFPIQTWNQVCMISIPVFPIEKHRLTKIPSSHCRWTFFDFQYRSFCSYFVWYMCLYCLHVCAKSVFYNLYILNFIIFSLTQKIIDSRKSKIMSELLKI